jgi:3-phenylpropionate/trans-cinnamate dioxygenase ferredoxin subunit
MQYITVCNTDDLPPGEREVFGIGDDWIAVFNVDGKYYAIADLCTHDEGPLADGDLNGFEIKCPRHGAKFDIRDGKAKTITVAPTDVPWYEVRVENDEVQIGLEA